MAKYSFNLVAIKLPNDSVFSLKLLLLYWAIHFEFEDLEIEEKRRRSVCPFFVEKSWTI